MTNFFSAFPYNTLAHDALTMPSTEGSAVQKISSGQAFIEMLNLCCDLDHDQHSNPIFSLDISAYDNVPLN